MNPTETLFECESGPIHRFAPEGQSRKCHSATPRDVSDAKRMYVRVRDILDIDLVILPTWGRQQSAAVESYEESISKMAVLQFKGSYAQHKKDDLPSAWIVSSDHGMREAVSDGKSAFASWVQQTLGDVFSGIESQSLVKLYRSVQRSSDSIEKIRQLRSWLASAELQIAGLMDVKCDTTVLEQFTGFVDYIEGPTAFVTLTTDAGEELAGEYPADEFAELGIRENRRFICQTVIADGNVEVLFQTIPDIEVTPEEEKAIDQRLDELISGCELDGDY